MRLNSLTLTGFKSFPTRTKLSFSHGVVAIVGPNGCGKSNIVDAFRWVLGEQSPSMIRAKGMDDCLFNGDGGKRVNMAEVRLVIENNGSVVPSELADSPEIEVIRRIHRSGDTEYRINGKPCRLKDIHYLFMDTGAGVRAYSILDQNQVGAFVNMGPEERRQLIEAVAGISRYRAKRVEAERRMARTGQNIERLEDLLIEVDRQRRSLSRQAKKTDRYLKLRKEQDQLDQALLAHAWSTEVKKRTEQGTEKESLSVTIAGIQAEISTEVVVQQGLELEVLEKEQTLAGIRQGLIGAETSLQEFREQASTHEKLLINDENRLKSADKTLLDLNEKAEWTDSSDERLKIEITGLKNNESSCLARVSDGEQGIEESETVRDQVRESLETAKVRFVDTAAKHTRLDSEHRGLRDRRDRLRRRIEQRQEELQAISGQIEGFENENERLGASIEECRTGLSALSQDETRLQSQASLLSARLEVSKKEMQEVDSELTTCRARLKALKNIDASGEGYSKATNRLLSSDVSTLGVLADFLQVEPGWENLVETALEQRVQAVVVPDREACHSAVLLLKSRPAGRASMIIPEDDQCEAGMGVEGTLLELVRAEPPVDMAVAEILKSWKVVPDLKTAFEARDAGDKSIFYITRDGEIIAPWGELVFGDQDKASSGILARKAEVSKLTILEKDLFESYTRISSKVKEIGGSLQETEAGLSKVNGEKRRLLEVLDDYKRERDRNLLKIEAQTERSRSIGFELEEAEEEVLETEVSLEGLEEAIQLACSAKVEAEGHIKGREEALRLQEQVLSRRRRALEKHRMELVRIQTQMQERERELDRLADQKTRIVRERERLLVERQGLEESQEDRIKSLDGVRLKVDAQQKAILNARTRLEEVELKYDKTRQAVSGVQDNIRGLQARLRNFEDRFHKNELALSEVEQGLMFIQRQAHERHQADIEECLDKWEISPFSPDTARERMSEITHKIDRIGPVNLGAVEEYEELEQRWDYLNSQKNDLLTSIDDLEQAIKRINRTCRTRFKDALISVNKSLCEVFPLLFEGGIAELELTPADDILDSGVDYLIQLPGKRIRHLNLLSGGEKALAAIALIFAIHLIKPSPFCLLDEVDAALDEANTVRFNRLIKRISEQSQVMLITHNQKVMEVAETLYGVTMEDKGVSKLVSVDLV